MGSFANSIFSALLGWVQSIAQSVWNALSAAPKDSALSWAGRNWIPLALFLCAFGVICDFVVYLFRWRPLRVWKRYFRRSRGSEKKELTDGQPETELFQGTSRAFEPAVEPEETADADVLNPESVKPKAPFSPGIRAEGRFDRQEEPKGLFNRWEEPEEAKRVDDSRYRRPQQESLETDFVRDHVSGAAAKSSSGQNGRREKALTEEENPTERYPETADIAQRLVRSGKRRRAARLVREFNETPDDSFPAASELINADEAYYRPVYPQKWQEQEFKNDDGAV